MRVAVTRGVGRAHDVKRGSRVRWGRDPVRARVRDEACRSQCGGPFAPGVAAREGEGCGWWGLQYGAIPIKKEFPSQPPTKPKNKIRYKCIDVLPKTPPTVQSAGDTSHI